MFHGGYLYSTAQIYANRADALYTPKLELHFFRGGDQGTEGGIELYPYVKEDFCVLKRITLEMFTSRFSKQLY